VPIKKGIAQLNIIGPQVRNLREHKGWTQDHFAVKLQLAGWDTSQDSVSRLENQGRRVPDLELFVLADVLGVRLDDLFPKDVRGKIKALWPLYRVKLACGQLPPRQ
jgi:transcriptional regulator with XRE-family HTH domain